MCVKLVHCLVNYQTVNTVLHTVYFFTKLTMIDFEMLFSTLD